MLIKKSVIKWEKTPSLCLDDIKVNQDKIDKIDEMLESVKDNDLKEKLKELYIKKEKISELYS